MYMLLLIDRDAEGYVDGTHLQWCCACSLEEAAGRARATEKVNSNRIEVAVVDSYYDSYAIGRYYKGMRRLDSPRKRGTIDMNYAELKQIFRELKRTSPKEDLTAHIVFTEDSFNQPYSLLSRTYAISSDNKAFWPSMGGYSIFGYCLDGTDQGIRLDYCMAEEQNINGWKVEDCYILEHMQDAAAIPNMTRMEQDDGSVCYFFADTCIRVHESHKEGKIRLEPVAGDQTACGEWVDLSIDRVHGYCTLLERHLNSGSGDFR